MVLSLKNDAINYFLAVRYNVSEAIHEGFFPWWSPYINLGYPLHGDMQSGVWNPFVLLLSAIRKYDIYWLHLETVLVVYLSGVTMHRLLRHLQLERKTALAVAVAYMGCGYIVDAGQFLNWLYAAALLPLVFLYAIRCFGSFRPRDAFFFGIAQSLMFLCAYPADFILLSYLVFFYTLFSFYHHSKGRGWRSSLKVFARQISIALLTFLIACLPAIVSYTQFMAHVDRGRGVSLELALSNSLAPANLISFVLPWATLKGNAFAQTDPLIRNCYMGILLFLFFLYFLFHKTRKTPLQKFLTGLFFVALVFSLGKFAGIRQLTYYTLPFMDSFRHPANAKLFFIFSGQLLAAYALQQFLTDRINRKLFRKLLMGLALLLAAAFLYGLFLTGLLTGLPATARDVLSATGIKKIKDQFSFADYVLLNSIWALIFLGLAALLLKKHLLKKFLVPLVFADVFITAQLMLPLTYVSTTRPQEVEFILQQQPKGYPLPAALTSLRTYSQRSTDYFAQIGCLNPFNKQPGRANYPITPSNLSLQDKFWADTLFREKVLDQPLAFLADTIVLEKDKSFFTSVQLPNRAVLANAFSTAPYKMEGEGSVEVKKFNPNYFEFETRAPEKSFFVLHQNYYPNWAMLINGHPAAIIQTNTSFMGGWVPAGTSNIQFVYKAAHLKWLGLFSLLFTLSGVLLFSFKTEQTSLKFEKGHH